MNLRLVGGRDNPFKPHYIDEPEENPALEPEGEDFGFPYRFTNAFIDSVEEIYNSINNGDYEGARESFHSQNIGTIFGEDMLRLRNDLQNGMELDAEEEELIKDLRDMVVGITRELQQHFGKRMRGGANPERVSDTIPSPHLFIRRQISFMRRVIERIDTLLGNPNHTEADVSEARELTRKGNEVLDYFDNHYSEIATDRYLNDEGLMEDYNNIVEQLIFLNQHFNMDYGSSESKTT